jgi:hypothetical protein
VFRASLFVLVAVWLPLPASAQASQEGETVVPAPAAPAPQAPAEPASETAPAATPATDAAAAPRRKLTEAGSRELTLDVDISREKSEDFVTKVTSLATKYGYCVTDNHEPGVLFSYLKVTDDFSTTTVYSLGPAYTYNVPSPPSDTVPFFGVAATLSRTEAEDSFGSTYTLKGRTLEATAGVRVFAADDVSVNFSAYYQKANLTAEIFSTEFDFDSTTYGLRVGVSGFLR